MGAKGGAVPLPKGGGGALPFPILRAAECSAAVRWCVGTPLPVRGAQASKSAVQAPPVRPGGPHPWSDLTMARRGEAREKIRDKRAEPRIKAARQQLFQPIRMRM